MHRIVAMMLIAVPMLPMPDDSSDKRPEVRAVSDGECLRGQRSISEPSDVGRTSRAVQSVAAEEAEIQEQSAQRGHPEAEGIQPRECHVARADHQRHQIVRKPEHQRHGDEEDHRRAVHGEHAIEDLRRNEIVVRPDELHAHDGRFDAAECEKDQRVQNVEDAEALVIHGGHPLVQAERERAGLGNFG